jgi:hypothetical protein
MRHVQKGLKVTVELEEWYNKSLGRSTVQVFVYDEHGEESEAMDWMIWYTGMSIEEVAAKLFPWADPQVDWDFYDDNDELALSEQEQASFAADIDNGIAEPGEDRDENVIRPYQDNGETATYRLALPLNDLGEAYLAVADYLEEE